MTAVFRIEGRGGEAASAGLRALPSMMGQVARKTVTAVAAWAGEELADQVAKESHVPRAVLLRRGGSKGPRVIFRLPAGRSAKISVWLGAKPIPAEYAGDAVQTPQGVRVGSHYLYGAFLARMPNGHVGVFQRAGTLARHSKGRPVHWQPNLPIVSAGIDLEAEGAIFRIQASIPEQLMQEADATFGKDLDRE